jgi:putative nucleotidyltransferase with HDIG domain
LTDATQQLAKLRSNLHELPVLPAVSAHVRSLDPDSDDYFDDIVGLAKQDALFAVRVLRAANSSLSAPSHEIHSLRQAVTRVGAGRAAELVLRATATRASVPGSCAERALWTHSVQTALGARKLGASRPGMHCDPDHAYLCGLLHDVGRFVQFQNAPKDAAAIDDTHWASPRELIERERAMLGYDHAELGWHVCHQWGLPRTLAEVVRRHHLPLHPPPHGHDDGGLHDLILCVQFGDAVSIALQVDPSLVEAPAEALAQRLAAMLPDAVRGLLPGEEDVLGGWVMGIHLESIEIARKLDIA